jgi:mRNA-degrading endonuclease RelE of RelBE toxin-antitoxin system
MAGHQPVIPPEVAEVIRHLSPDVKRAVKAALRKIGSNPAAGEPLQGELEGSWKFRVRRFRIVYQIDDATRVARITAFGERRSIYEDVARLRRSQK